MAPCPTAMRWPGDHDREIAMLRLAQHQLTLMRAERERAQEVAIEVAQPRPEHAVAERNFGLLDRGRKHDVEADRLGAAGDDRG